MTSEDFKHEADSIRSSLHSVALHYLHRQEDAQDTVQDVMLKLWQMVDQLHSPMAPLARVLTRNFCIDRIRRNSRLRYIENCSGSECRKMENVVDSTAPPPQQEMIDRMMSVIEHLPPNQQLILRLRHMENMETKEIAHLTGQSEAAIRQTLCRARHGVRIMYMNQSRSDKYKDYER